MKDNESQNETSNSQEGESSIEDLFSNSNKDDNTSSVSTLLNSETSKFANTFQLRASTPNPNAPKTGKLNRGGLDEDDLEITEVRDVPLSQEGNSTEPDALNPSHLNSQPSSVNLPALSRRPPQPPNECDMDASSNDVLLEAFTNTQKICSNLKQELHRVQTENSKLKVQVQSYQIDKEKLTDKFAEYKNLLNSFSERTNSLFEQKRREDSQLNEFKDNYEKLVKKVEGYRDDIHELKNNLSQLRFLKMDSETELAKRTKEIEYLKKELDSCSGQLSEEKLKNSSLVQEFHKIRNELTENLTQSICQGQSKILEKISLFEANIIGAYQVNLNKVSESSITKMTECMGSLQMNLASEFSNGLHESNKILFNNYQKMFVEFIERFNLIDQNYDKLWNSIKEHTESQNIKFDAHTTSLLTELQRSKDDSSAVIKKWSNENMIHLQAIQDDINNGHGNSFKLIEKTTQELKNISGDIQKGLTKHQTESFEAVNQRLQKLPYFFDGLHEGQVKSDENMQKLAQELSTYRESLISCHDYESNISELESRISSLQLQKSQALSSLGTKEAQYEDMCKSMISKETEISKFKEIEKELHHRIGNVSSEVEQQRNKLLRFNEENITLKANSENKLLVQNELLKAFQSENETLKQRTAQLEEMREQYEKENSTRLDKIQRINEQLQKLNVERVQLKAHELELEEDNRNLKRSIEDNKLEFEDTTDDYKRLKQKVIVLESDKQDLVSEKLELQDQMEKMQSAISGLKQKVSSLKEIEGSHLKQIEAQAAEVKPAPEKTKAPQNKIDKKNISSKKRTRELPGPTFKSQVPPSLPPPPKATHMELKPNSNDKNEETDEFDLSSSLNDDLELTNPSPIKPVTAKRGDTKIRSSVGSRKKLLLLDEQESAPLKHKWKKRRT